MGRQPSQGYLTISFLRRRHVKRPGNSGKLACRVMCSDIVSVQILQVPLDVTVRCVEHLAHFARRVLNGIRPRRFHDPQEDMI
jgi:hypothetical protein